MLKRDATLEELAGLLRCGIRMDSEANGFDTRQITMWSYGQHVLTGEQLLNDEDADWNARRRILDAVLTYSLVQLRAMQKNGRIRLTKADKEIVRQARNYLVHPEMPIVWEGAAGIHRSGGVIKHQGVRDGHNIRDVDFGYALGILQLCLELKAKTSEVIASS